MNDQMKASINEWRQRGYFVVSEENTMPVKMINSAGHIIEVFEDGLALPGPNPEHKYQDC